MKEIIANKQHNASVDCCLYEQTNALLLYGPLHPNSEHPDHIPEISARFDAVNVKKKKKAFWIMTYSAWHPILSITVWRFGGSCDFWK